MTIISGHKLTRTEVNVLDAVRSHMAKHSGDSWLTALTSPRGDGRAVPVLEIFPNRDNHDNARRRTVRRLAELGVLQACEIQYADGMLHAQLTIPHKPVEPEPTKENG